MKRIMGFVIVCILFVFPLSACGEKEYSWNPDEKQPTSTITTTTTFSNATTASTSTNSSKSNSMYTTTTGTPLSKDEDSTLKAEMDQLINDLIGEE